MAAVPPDKPGGPTDPGGSASGPSLPTSGQEQWPSLPQTQGPSTSNGATGKVSQKTSRRSIGIHQIAFNNALEEQSRQRTAPPPASYANAAEATSTRHPYHLKISYKKSHNVSNTTLDDGQLATLVWNRLMVPEGKCLGIDTSHRDHITVIVDGSVPISSLAVQYGFEAKPGLFTRPIAPVIRQKRVAIYQVDYNTDEELITEALRPFGKVTTEVYHQTYEIKPSETNTLIRKLDGVKKADRYVWMKVVSHIPSFIMVGNKRAKVIYDGQPRQCGRCLKRLHLCPGGGKAEVCEKLHKDKDPRAVERANLKEFWDNAVEEAIKATQDASYDSDCIRADYVDCEHVPEEMTKEEIMRFLSDASISILENQLEPKGKGKWRISGLMPDEVTCMMLLIHDRKVGPRNRIKCCPVLTSTPRTTPNNSNDDGGFDPNSAGSSPVLPAAPQSGSASPSDPSSPMDASASSSLPPLPSDTDSSGPGDGTAALLALGADLEPRNLSNVFGNGDGNGMVSQSSHLASNPNPKANSNPQNNNDEVHEDAVKVGEDSSSMDTLPSVISTEESASVEEVSVTSGEVISKRRSGDGMDKVLNVTEQEQLQQDKLVEAELRRKEREEKTQLGDDDDDGDIGNDENGDEGGEEETKKEDWSIATMTKRERRRMRQEEAIRNGAKGHEQLEKREGSVKRKLDYPTPEKEADNVTQRNTRMRATDKTLGVLPKPTGGGKGGGKGGGGKSKTNGKNGKSPKSK